MVLNIKGIHGTTHESCAAACPVTARAYLTMTGMMLNAFHSSEGGRDQWKAPRLVARACSTSARPARFSGSNVRDRLCLAVSLPNGAAADRCWRASRSRLLSIPFRDGSGSTPAKQLLSFHRFSSHWHERILIDP